MMSQLPSVTRETHFTEIVALIAHAQKKAYQAVNTCLIDLYWQIGEYINRKLEAAEWGEGVVDQLAKHIDTEFPCLRGFTRSNLFRMRQFKLALFERAILNPPKVSAVLRQIHSRGLNALLALELKVDRFEPEYLGKLNFYNYMSFTIWQSICHDKHLLTVTKLPVKNFTRNLSLPMCLTSEQHFSKLKSKI